MWLTMPEVDLKKALDNCLSCSREESSLALYISNVVPAGCKIEDMFDCIRMQFDATSTHTPGYTSYGRQSLFKRIEADILGTFQRPGI